MKRSRASALVVGLLLAGATTAQAGTLTTALAYRAGTFFDCAIVNAGTREIVVTIQAIGEDGNVYLQLLNHTLAGGDAAPLEVSPALVAPNRMYCKFILTKGSKASVRASYCVEEAPGLVRCIATGDAR
jgi:hypothetical protein